MFTLMSMSEVPMALKGGIRQTVIVSYLTKMLQRPVRFIEDRLENMAGGENAWS